MNKLRQLLLAPIALALFPSCTSHAVPDEALPHVEALARCEAMELFSIDPDSGYDGPVEGADRLRGCRVLGRAKVEAAADRAEVARLVAEGIAESDGSLAHCFLPRHGLRVEVGGVTHELVVCYECLTVRAWAPEAAEFVTIPTSNGIEPALTALFERHGLKIAGGQ